MSVLEAVMLICFGVSWPVSISKAIRTKVVAGKSPTFMIIVCMGYVAGIVHKVLCSCDWIIFLYGLNLIMVVIDLILYYRYIPRQKVC